jgi:hypothetical protein
MSRISGTLRVRRPRSQGNRKAVQRWRGGGCPHTHSTGDTRLAATLGVALALTKGHVAADSYSIFVSKLGVESRARAVAVAARRGFL